MLNDKIEKFIFKKKHEKRVKSTHVNIQNLQS